MFDISFECSPYSKLIFAPRFAVSALYAVLISIYLSCISTVAFMVSASFHAGCRQGSLTVRQKRGQAQELLEELGNPPPVRAVMTLENISFV